MEQKKKNINIDELAISAIRSNCIDCINNVKSGHPGMALSSAPILYELYKDFLVINPKYPNWINRDRLVLSAGHCSILLYTILHLSGYEISKEDLLKFRKLGSITPGHPEYGVTPGVDASSGPLGQGIAEAVGIAIAEKKLSDMYSDQIYNHYTYCLCGDGCLQEGISQEAIEYAGFQKLDKLILLYDKNNVTLDGPLSQSCDCDVALRFKAAGWNVVLCKNGNDIKQIRKAFIKAKSFFNEKPTLIIFETVIGYGSINQGTCKVHGSPLGEEDAIHAKKIYGFDMPKFTLPQEIYDVLQSNIEKRIKLYYNKFQNNMEYIKKKDPILFKTINDLSTNNIKDYLNIEHLKMDEFEKEATRNTSQRIINYYHNQLTNFIGGSADVANSVMTNLKNKTNFVPNDLKGENLNWGIREFLMCAASNGILLHGGLRTYAGCFLMFSDYAKNAIRMASLQKLPQIFLFSHDSIVVGEDGPTHQPIEQLIGLRATPNLNVFRPCDAKETYAAWRLALESTETPTCIILSRQALPLLENTSNYEEFKKGAYIVSKEDNKADLVLIASGSEVSLAITVKELLKKRNIDVRVVSMPSFELFNKQSQDYEDLILGKDYNKCVSIEMSSTYGWKKYANFNYGIDEFGASGNAEDLIKAYKFTPDDVFDAVLCYYKSLK
ncbi:MAG: transketolase [Bacillales bacterium]